MNKSIVAIAVAGLVGAVGFSSVASAEATVYGRVTAGAVHSDRDTDEDDGAWNFGATGIDGANGRFNGTRFGFKGSQDLGNGMSAGFQIEREVRQGETPATVRQRHNLVWLSGSWGKLTFGNQNNPYLNARHWDQTYFYGGNFGASYRHEGINYSMSNGPFSLNVMATAQQESVVVNEGTTVHYYTANPGDGATRIVADATSDDHVAGAPLGLTLADGAVAATQPPTPCSTASATCALGYTLAPGTTGDNADPSTITRTVGREVDDSSGIDTWILHAGYDFGPVALNVAHHANQTEASSARSRTAIGFNGSAGPLDWYLAHEATELENATGAAENDVSSTGGFLGFSASERDTIYGYYVAHSADQAGTIDGSTVGEDYTETIVGYSRDMGPGLRFIAEYQSVDNDLEGDGSDTSNLALAVRYVF